MYKRTEFITEIQQSGTDEIKPLFFTADPSPARAMHITAYIEGAEDGSPENKRLFRIESNYSSDGSDFNQTGSENSSDNEVGDVNWQAMLIQDGSTGPITFGFHAGYGTNASGGSSGTYTVNWKIRLEVEEFD